MTSAPPRARLPERELARFGPLSVTRASLGPLRIVLGVAALVNAILLGVLVALWSKMRKLEAALAEASQKDEKR
jgi:hypothetical protein